MGLASFVRTAFNSSLSILSAEDVTIGAETKKGVIEDIGTELFIGEGGLTWQISRVDNGPGSLVIDLEEPERRG